MNKRLVSKSSKKGFTLVELIVVIAIVAILSAVSVVGYLGFLNYANQSAANQEADQFKKSVTSLAVSSYKGRTPATDGWTIVNSTNGLRIYNENHLNSNPTIAISLQLLGEAFTYSNAPTKFTSSFQIDDSNLICNGLKTDESKGAIYNPLISYSLSNYYITQVTYQSSKKIESIVKFTNLEDLNIFNISESDENKIPSNIAIKSGIPSSIAPNELIDKDLIWATITYSDGTTADMPSSRLDITTPTDLGTGTYSVKYNHPLLATSLTASKTVTSSGTDIAITSVEMPKNIQKNQRMRNVSSSTSSGFYNDSNYIYRVGNKNEFVFSPIVYGTDNQGENISINPLKCGFSVKVFDEHDAEMTNTVYSSTNFSTTNKIDFADTVTGKYTIKISKDSYELVLPVEVFDAINIYAQSDLDDYNNTSSESDSATKQYGLIFQNDLTIAPNKLNKKFFYTSSNDAGFDSAKYKIGDLKITSTRFYDHCFKNGETTANGKIKQFIFDGNYYTIDSSLVPVAKATFADAIGNDQYALFNFKQQTYTPNNASNFPVDIQFSHINSIGNTPKSANDKYFGGLYFAKFDNVSHSDISYVNTRRYYITYGPSNNCGDFYINKCKSYDNFNCFVYNYGCGEYNYMNRVEEGNNDLGNYNLTLKTSFDDNIANGTKELSTFALDEIKARKGGLRIYNSEFVNCGGPVVISDWVFDNGGESWQGAATNDFFNSRLESLVTGAEPFFVATGMTTQVGTITNLNALGASHWTYINDNKQMNAICVIKSNKKFSYSSGTLTSSNPHEIHTKIDGNIYNEFNRTVADGTTKTKTEYFPISQTLAPALTGGAPAFVSTDNNNNYCSACYVPNQGLISGGSTNLNDATKFIGINIDHLTTDGLGFALTLQLF